MKEYLKMADYVDGSVSISLNRIGEVVIVYDYANPNMMVRNTMNAMEHAINSHDELVAEVERLSVAALAMKSAILIASNEIVKNSPLSVNVIDVLSEFLGSRKEFPTSRVEGDYELHERFDGPDVYSQGHMDGWNDCLRKLIS